MNFNSKHIYLFFTISLLFQFCNGNIKEFLHKKPKPKIYLEAVEVGIKIDYLSSISSRSIPEEKEESEINYRSKSYGRWFYLQLANSLEKEGFRITNKKEADLIIKTSIVDMSEIRPKMFIEGLSIGLVFGLIAGELSGDPQVGLGVFLLEVVEEFVILYILKSYFLVTTIETEFISAKGDLLKSTEFTAYSNKEYISKLPKQKQDIRENKVRASLDQNAKDIVEYLKDYTNQNN